MSETRIGVISDTHYTSGGYASTQFPFDKIRNIFANTNLIIHCGDIVSLDMLEKLAEIAPVEAVCGNMDSMETNGHIPKQKVIGFFGMNIGIIHGFGPRDGFPGKLFKAFEGLPSMGGGKLDALVFGHTHIPFNERLNGILCFNPGSPVKPHAGFDASVGILTVSPGHPITGEILNI